MVSLGLIMARFNPSAMEQTKDATRDAAAEYDVAVVETIQVPGAYDSPLTADRLARRGDIDVVVVVGAIVTGDTDHDRTVADAITKSLTEVSLDRDKPVSFGVLGPDVSGVEAHKRVDKGTEAAYAVTDMVEALV